MGSLQQQILTLAHFEVTKDSNYTPYFTNQLKKQIHHLLNEIRFMHKVQYVGKVETASNIKLNNHMKVCQFAFQRPGHSFSLHAKFTLIEQLSSIHTTDKDTIKFRLKRRQDFRIQKFETLIPKKPKQELNNI